ncbi:MAG: LysR family transcriptional regulator [Pusillimonas sp.]|nr:LysR family transcriptional regulator [Pusillimonas sp.]
MKLNLHLTRIFFTVVRENSFSKAAKVLFVSQPAVSKAVRELESQLGLDLLERTAGGQTKNGKLRLTDSGRALYARAREIFALEQLAVNDLEEHLSASKGRLTIGASTTVASYWLPPLLARYKEGHEDVALRVVVGNTESICHDLKEYRIDLAVIEGTTEDPLILSKDVLTEKLNLIAPACFQLSTNQHDAMAQLNSAVWLVRERGSGTRTVTESLLQANHIVPSGTIEFGSNEGIARAVSHGLGVAMLPNVVTQELAELGRIKTLAPPFLPEFQRKLKLLTRVNSTLSPVAEAFARQIITSPPDIQSVS